MSSQFLWCDSWFGLRPHQLSHHRNWELITGRNIKNPQTEWLRKHTTPLRKRNGKHVFPLTESWRFLMFPSLRTRRNRTTFFLCFRRISAKGNKCFRERNCVVTLAETQGNVPEMCLFVCFRLAETQGNVLEICLFVCFRHVIGPFVFADILV